MKTKCTVALIAIALFTTSVHARYSTESKGQKGMWPGECFLAGSQRPNMVLVNGYCYYKPTCRDGYQFDDLLGQCVLNSKARY